MFLVLSLLFIVLGNDVGSTAEYNSQSESPGKFRNMYKLSASVYDVSFSLFSV